MKKTALLIMLITIISKLFGFARELTLAYFYGASSVSDAYLVSITIPGVIFGFIAAGLVAGYIPMYSKIMHDDGEIAANRFTSNLVNILIVLCSFLIILGLLFTDQIVKIFAVGFTGDTLALAVNFTKISLLAIYFTGVITIYSGYLQIKGNFVVPALIGFPLNLLIILSIVLSSLTNILVLAVGFVVASASQLLLMKPFMRKLNYKHRFAFDVKDKNIVNLAYIALPIIIGLSVNQINIIVDRTIASQITVGGISALNYANKLNGFVQGIFVSSIAVVLFPVISRMAAEKNLTGLKKSLAEAITGINLLVIPATAGFMLFATPIVSVLFSRGAFDVLALSMTSYALFFYAIGMIGFGLRDVVSRAFYSLQDTKTPMINATIGVVLNIILNIILSKYMGIGGLALATSIAAIFTSGLLLISLRKKIGPLGMKQITISSFKIIFASLAMVLLAKISFNYLTVNLLSQNLSLLLAIGVGAVSYFIIIYFMKIEEVDAITNAIKGRLG